MKAVFVGLCLFIAGGILADDGIPLESLLWRYGLEKNEDSRAQKITVVGEGINLTLALNMDIILFNGKAYLLRQAVQETSAGVVVSSEVEQLIASVGKIKVSAKPARRKKSKVVLDAGHGGKFPGAVQNGISEKDLNLAVAKIVRDILVAYGVEVVMTRTGDAELSENWSKDLDARVEISNRANADLFVSIHANSDERKDSSGSEVYIARESEDAGERVAKSIREAPTIVDRYGSLKSEKDLLERKILHRLLLEEKYRRSYVLANSIAEMLKKNPHDEFNKINDCGFRVVKWTRAPAVLVEMGYISNPQTAALFRKQDYQEFIAKLIADGILRYIEKCSVSGDFSDSGQVEEKLKEKSSDEKRVQPKEGQVASYNKEEEN